MAVAVGHRLLVITAARSVNFVPSISLRNPTGLIPKPRPMFGNEDASSICGVLEGGPLNICIFHILQGARD